MTPGTYISGAGHAGLLIWMLAGWGLASDPLEFEVTEVAVVSAEEFAMLTRSAPPSAPQTETPVPEAPEVQAALPDLAEETPPDPAPPPETVTPPAPEVAPVVPEPAPVPPPAEVTDVVPELIVPEVPEAPSVPEDLAESPRPEPRPAPRVAPEPVAPPPPEAEIDDSVREAAEASEAPAEEVVETPEEATAPEEAATEIVTEAEEPSGAPLASIRPQLRPNRAAAPPEAPATETAAAASDADPVEDAVAAALADAATGTSAPEAPAGPPLTGGEVGGVISAISREWGVDVGSRSADVTIVVAFELSPEGRLTSTPELISSQGGDPAAVSAAFRSARTAIIAASRQGAFALPPEKYDQWREMEITFDPSGMRLR